MTEKEEWCPTQGGTFTAYEPEYRQDTFASADAETWTEWKAVPVSVVPGHLGVPYPLVCAGVLSQIGLCGHAQAQALAWGFAAASAAAGKEVEVRVSAYEVHYDIKARRIAAPPGDSGSQS